MSTDTKKTLLKAIAAEKVCTTQEPRNLPTRDKSNIARPIDLPSITGLSKTTCWRLERVGDFPRRIKLSAGAVGYKTSELLAWLESRQTLGA